MTPQQMKELREKRNEKSRQANALVSDKGSQTWTSDDKKVFDGLADEIGLLDAQIEAAQSILDDGAISNFNDVKRLTPEQRAAREKDQVRQGVETFLRVQSRHMTADQAEMVRNTMSTTTDSEGGYTVPKIVSGQVIDILKDYQGIRRVATQQTTGDGRQISWPTSDGTAEEGEIVGQNVTASDLDIGFGTVAMNVCKASSKVVTIPIELLQDSEVDIIALIYARFADRIGRLQNRLMTRDGDGTNGIPFSLISRASVGKVGATGTTVTIGYDDLVDLQESIDPAYQTDRQGWMFSQSVRKLVRKLKDSAGRPIWTPSYDGGIQKIKTDLLLDAPIQINNHMPVPAANAKSISYGDHSKYLVRDVMGLTIFKFEDSAYIKKGQIGFLGWVRFGGNMLDPNAVKTWQHSAT